VPPRSYLAHRSATGKRRADDPVRADVIALLEADLSGRAQAIEVDVEHGHVVLRGEAPSHRDRARAEQLARLVSGVASVENLLSTSAAR
jgi:osmotically-inducible protein OsmY